MNLLHEALRPTHAARVERWLGRENVDRLQIGMRGWYGTPIALLDTPGCVKIGSDGDFVGRLGLNKFSVGLEWSVFQMLERARMMAGFASISDALSRRSQGYGQDALVTKVGPTGVAGVTSSLYGLGTTPVAGAAPGNAPGGTAFTNASTGAIKWTNPAAGTSHLIGADMSASVINNTLLLYDLLFGCNKTVNASTAEAVTGVPTRYQGTTPANPDFIGNNFLFIQVGGTILAATAHNHTVVTYTDHAGVGSTLPSLTGNSAGIIHRLDHPVQQWFAPLENGDLGIKTLTQMQHSAAIATGVLWYMIGHPIGFMNFPVINSVLPFDWLTNRDLAPRVFDSAFLALLEILKPATGTTTYTGMLHFATAAA